MPQSDASFASKIQKLEEELTFLDDYVTKQNREILQLQKKQDKIITELKELRTRFESRSESENGDYENPPHY